MQVSYGHHIINTTHRSIAIQRHAARFVSSNYDWYVSVTQMLNNIEWLTMSQRREKLQAIKFS